MRGEESLKHNYAFLTLDFNEPHEARFEVQLVVVSVGSCVLHVDF